LDTSVLSIVFMFLAQKQLHCTENQFKTTFPEFWTSLDSFGQLSGFRAHFGFETADGTNCSRSGDSSFDLSSRDKNCCCELLRCR